MVNGVVFPEVVGADDVVVGSSSSVVRRELESEGRSRIAVFLEIYSFI